MNSGHFRITNTQTKAEIFKILEGSENVSEDVKELTIAEKTKTQRTAFIVLTIIFLIAFLFSAMIEKGALPDGRYPAILVLLGSLGMLMIGLFYIAIVLIIGIKYYLLSKTKRIIHTLKFN